MCNWSVVFGVHILPLTMLSLTCIASKGVPSDALIVALDVALAYNAVVVVAVVLALLNSLHCGGTSPHCCMALLALYCTELFLMLSHGLLYMVPILVRY